MEVRRLARAAFSCPPVTTSTVLNRLYGNTIRPAFPGVSVLAIQRQERRQLSSTPVRLSDQNSSAPPSWPPSRPATQQPNDGKRNTAVPASQNPLEDMYPSKDPASWAMWSSDDFYRRHAIEKPQGPTLKLGPAIGRTVYVGGNVDQARAFLLMHIESRRNGVQTDWSRQRFYERGGTKRKRLKSQRWRRRFKNIFRDTLHRVQHLARQGW